MNDKLLRRFAELYGQSKDVEATIDLVRDGYDPDGDNLYVQVLNAELFLAWKVKARNLLKLACGPSSEHVAAFAKEEEIKGYDSNVNAFKRCQAVFSAANEDYEGGYVTSAEELVRAEVFDQELDQAKELLTNGYTAAAAVVAGVVLETTLRGMCNLHSLGIGSMERMNQDLTKAGVYNVLVQKQVTAMAHIRNKAAHGETDQYSDVDVRKMVTDVGDFVAKHVGI